MIVNEITIQQVDRLNDEYITNYRSPHNVRSNMSNNSQVYNRFVFAWPHFEQLILYILRSPTVF